MDDIYKTVPRQRSRRRSLNSIFIPNRLTYEDQKKEYAYFLEDDGKLFIYL
jgi:hypothetical protein